MNAVCLAQLLNTMLLLQTPTSHLAKARLTLVPKKGTPKQPGDFRPTGVSSVLLRLLHKVLARRWRSSINLNPWQLAFQQRDVCLEASSALHPVLRNAHSMVKPLAAAVIDVAKALDTVCLPRDNSPGCLRVASGLLVPKVCPLRCRNTCVTSMMKVRSKLV